MRLEMSKFALLYWGYHLFGYSWKKKNLKEVSNSGSMIACTRIEILFVAFNFAKYSVSSLFIPLGLTFDHCALIANQSSLCVLIVQVGLPKVFSYNSGKARTFLKFQMVLKDR